MDEDLITRINNLEYKLTLCMQAHANAHETKENFKIINAKITTLEGKINSMQETINNILSNYDNNYRSINRIDRNVSVLNDRLKKHLEQYNSHNHPEINQLNEYINKLSTTLEPKFQKLSECENLLDCFQSDIDAFRDVIAYNPNITDFNNMKLKIQELDKFQGKFNYLYTKINQYDLYFSPEKMISKTNEMNEIYQNFKNDKKYYESTLEDLKKDLKYHDGLFDKQISQMRQEILELKPLIQRIQKLENPTLPKPPFINPNINHQHNILPPSFKLPSNLIN